MPRGQQGNPYYIEPAGAGLGQGLAGLGEIIDRNRQRKSAEEEKDLQAEQIAQAQTQIREAIRSGDPSRIADVSIQYPSFRESIESSMTIGGDIRDQQMEDEKRFYQDILTDREGAVSHTQNRIDNLTGMGRDVTQSAMLLEELNDPEGRDEAFKSVESLYALRYPDEFKDYQSLSAPGESGDTAAFRTLASRAEAAGLTAGSPEYQTFMRYGGPEPPKPAGPAASARERVIGSYQELFDMTEEEATRRYDARPMMDDLGNLITYDPISGTGSMTTVERGAAPDLLDAPTGTAIEDLAFDPGEGTGFGASFVGLWNSTLGQAPFLPIGRDTAESAQNLRVLERDAISALASSGRPPVVEQERIASIIPRAMDPFQNPEEAQYKMTNFVDLMMNQYVDDMRYSQDRNNPREVREESTGRARRIESIVRRVLEPEAARAMFNSLERVEGEIGEIRNMPISELEALDYQNLTDSQLDIYIERLQSGN